MIAEYALNPDLQRMKLGVQALHVLLYTSYILLTSPSPALPGLLLLKLGLGKLVDHGTRDACAMLKPPNVRCKLSMQSIQRHCVALHWAGKVLQQKKLRRYSVCRTTPTIVWARPEEW